MAHRHPVSFWTRASVYDRASGVAMRHRVLWGSHPGEAGFMHWALTPGRLAPQHCKDSREPSWRGWRKRGQAALPPLPGPPRHRPPSSCADAWPSPVTRWTWPLLLPWLLNLDPRHRFTPDSVRMTPGPAMDWPLACPRQNSNSPQPP